ncbi:uncharacterized protein LOC117121875 [Anneissia japonica]|uniref:uncharacterized protein LOC117121875 n=1 Tax=Anneissia japonica TaxID=1529436 RepID=UPI0014256DB5|nr:uncharacterized protein LOC117121875 [Anneissia japonica]
MMTLQHLVPVVFVAGLFLSLETIHCLDPNGDNVCSTQIITTERYTTQVSYQSPTYTSCWLFRCLRYRTRYRYSISYRNVYSTRYECCQGYAAPPGSDECTETICLPECFQGNCEGPNVCTCNEGYHGPRCEYTCDSEIYNCEIINCTSSIECKECLYHINDEIKAYDLVNGRCNPICSWRNDSRSCYPGRCASSSNVCICDADFDSDDNCMKISVPPTVKSCSILLQHDNGFNGISTSNISCQQSYMSPIYSSIKGNSFLVNWQTQFSATEYPFPYYVNDSNVGVISAVVNWYIDRGGNIIDSGEIDCSLNHNEDDPNKGIHVCTRYEKLKDNLQNNDNLTITSSSTNGGFLKLNNYDYSVVGRVDNPVYYEGKTVTRSLTITVDIDAPTHCSLFVPRDTTCIGFALDIGDPYTTSSHLKVKWSTWVDHISGLTATSYDCRICKMVANNGVLTFDNTCVVLTYSKRGNYYEAEFELNSPGVYCAVLSVSDVAGSIRLARRCLIFDSQSEISIADDKPIAWTSVDKTFKVSWQGHFVNQLHIDQSMLNAIETDNDVINEAYDSDALPAGRALSSIGNRHGIVKFEVGIAKDGLQPNWMDSPNDLEEMFVYQNNNGEETVEFWIRATDVVNNTKTDFVSIHIDSTSLSIGHIGGIAGGGVVFVILTLILVVYLFKSTTKRQNPQVFGDNNGHENPVYTIEVEPNQYATPNYPPPEYTPYLPMSAAVVNSKKGLVEGEYEVPFSQNVFTQENITANEIHPYELRKDGVIFEGNLSQVCRGRVPSLGLTNVAIKTVKEDHNVKEKENMLHEIKMIRLLPRHENIIRLLGFTSIRDPVALVLEFAPYANLSKYLQSLAEESPYDNQIEEMSSSRLCTFAWQVCSGMQRSGK